MVCSGVHHVVVCYGLSTALQFLHGRSGVCVCVCVCVWVGGCGREGGREEGGKEGRKKERKKERKKARDARARVHVSVRARVRACMRGFTYRFLLRDDADVRFYCVTNTRCSFSSRLWHILIDGTESDCIFQSPYSRSMECVRNRLSVGVNLV